MQTLTLPAPAKLNLFLHINGRREDGYHNLQTVFQLLNYGDTLHFKPRSDDQILLLSDFDIPMEQNLIWRAAKSLSALTPRKNGITIQLEKRLPLGGGVGGGSSDAATTLVALNKLWGLNLPINQLAAIGKQLGADVPVFIYGHSAWGEGIGELLTPVKLPPSWYLVLVPECQVTTAEIFSHPELTRDTPRITIHDFLAGAGRNDFEPLVRKRYPVINEALNWLTQFNTAHLTGSGSSVFAAFPTFNQAMQVAKQVPSCYKYFIAEGVNRSPLFAAPNGLEQTTGIS
ncbi:MAG TPA: 4-(cytidine 5'-diphospho)-2-C-methyl-D-erythritol kinase [Gammaproteobacteria bacterium]|nr:4-(cytidine 5'-diphospho)-2-C-methyl-D-erythritol kinase [Gammaproteobacteria bacterium]